MKDYYSLLGLDSSATKADVKKNYRQLANKFHPDKNSAPDASEIFISISEAYDVLSNKKSRAQYDLYRWSELKQKQQAAKESFTSAVPTFESTRSRRNKEQKARSIKFHQDKKSNVSLKLIRESLYIFSRYIFHILGVSFFIAILSSVIATLADTFSENAFRGLVLAAFLGGLGYGIYWILNNAYQEWKKDVDSFQVFFKISRNKAINLMLYVFAFVLILYVILLRVAY